MIRRPRSPIRLLPGMFRLGLLALTAWPCFFAPLRPLPAAEDAPKETTAEEKTAAELLPATTVLYAEVPIPADVLELILDHPLRARLAALPPYQEAIEKPAFLRLKAAVAIFEAELELPWRKLVGVLGEGGVYLGFDAGSQGAAVLMRARDEASLVKARETLLGLARAEAERQERDDPVKTETYRDTTAYRLGGARFVTFGRWLMITNKDELGKKLIDAQLDAGGEVLARNETFQDARASRAPEADAWLYVDLQTIRAAERDEKGDKGLFGGPRDNPAAELLLGGIFTAIRQAPYATLSLFADSQAARLVARTPFDPEWIDPSRTYFFGVQGQGTAPPLLKVKRPIASLSAYRDVSQMWLRAGDLFNEQVTDNLAQADSNLSTLFSGKDFGEDILGSFRPEVQVVVARQDFRDRSPIPAIKLPSFAVVARMKDPKTVQPEIRRTFLSLIGFLNVVGAMNGQPQLDFEMQSVEGGQLIAAEYVVEEKHQGSTEAPINYNFSPTIAFRDPFFIVASSRELARELLAAVADEPPKAETAEASRPNTLAAIDLGGLRDILRDNMNQLIAQNMLEEGHTREEAEGEVGLLLKLVGLLHAGDLRLSSGDGQMVLEAGLRLAESPSDSPARPAP